MRDCKIKLRKCGSDNEWIITERENEIAIIANKDDAYLFYNTLTRIPSIPYSEQVEKVIEVGREKARFLICGNHIPYISDDVYYYLTHTLDVGGKIARAALATLGITDTK